MKMKIGLASALILGLLFTTAAGAMGALERTTLEAKSISKHHHKYSDQGHFMDDLAKALEMDSQTLKQELKSGKTLREVASARGIDQSSLLKKLESQINERLDQSVKEGKLTLEKGELIKTRLPDKLSKLLNKKWDQKYNDHHKGSKKELFKGVREQIQSTLDLTPDTLRAEFKSGKSLAQIAQEKGINPNELASQIQETVEENLEQLVKENKVSAEEEQEIRQKLPERIEKMMQRVHKEK